MVNQKEVIQVPVEDLMPHPRNGEFFSDIPEGTVQWKDFVESIKNRGIMNPLLITKRNVVIAGHQRLRAAIELGLNTVPCLYLPIDDENSPSALVVLIDTNIQQRGSSGASPSQQRHIAETLEECMIMNRWNSLLISLGMRDFEGVDDFTQCKRLEELKRNPPSISVIKGCLKNPNMVMELENYGIDIDEDLDEMQDLTRRLFCVDLHTKEDAKEGNKDSDCTNGTNGDGEGDEQCEIDKNITKSEYSDFVNNLTNDGADDGESIGSTQFTEKELVQMVADKMGVSTSWITRLRALKNLCPTLMDKIDEGVISADAASKLLTKLSPKEQAAFIEHLPTDLTTKITKKQMEGIVKQIKEEADSRTKELQDKLTQKERELQDAQLQLETMELSGGQQEEYTQSDVLPQIAALQQAISSAQNCIERFLQPPIELTQEQKYAIGGDITSLSLTIDALKTAYC